MSFNFKSPSQQNGTENNNLQDYSKKEEIKVKNDTKQKFELDTKQKLDRFPGLENLDLSAEHFSLDNIPEVRERPQCFTQYKELPHSLFSHIHIDHLLNGSHLQSTPGDVTITKSLGGKQIHTHENNQFPIKHVLEKMIDYIINNDTGMSKESVEYLRSNIKKLKQDFATIKYFADFSKKVVESINKKPEVTLKNIDDFILGFAQKIYGFVERNNEVIFQVNWSHSGDTSTTNDQLKRLALELTNSPDPDGIENMVFDNEKSQQNVRMSHKMCVKIVKNTDGAHHAIIMNTGDGLIHHLTNVKTKTKHHAAMTFSFPNEIDSTKIIKYIKELIAPGIKGDIATTIKCSMETWEKETEFNGSTYYTKAVAKSHLYGGEEISPDKLLSLQTKGQDSGICDSKIWFPILYSRIQGKPFHEFIFQLRYQTILDYYRILKEQYYLGLPIVTHVLLPACHKLARTIEKYNKRTRRKKTNLICPKLTTRVLAELRNIEIDVNTKFLQHVADQHHPTKNLPRVEFDNKAKEELASCKSSSLLKNDLFLVEQLEAEAKKKEKEIVPIPVKLLPKREEFQYPLDYLKACYEILSQYHDDGYWSTIVKEIDNLFINMPSDYKVASEYWNRIKQRDAEETIRYLHGIITLYYTGKEQSGILNYLLPRPILTGNICSLMASFVTSIYFSGNPLFSIFDLKLPQVPFISEPTEAITFDPVIDKKFAEFEKLAVEILAKNEKNKHDKVPRPTKPNKPNLLEDNWYSLRDYANSFENYEKHSTDYYDILFLEHYINKDIFNEIEGLEQNKDISSITDRNNDRVISKNYFENARMNLYRVCRTQIYKENQEAGRSLPEKFEDGINKPLSTKAREAIKDYRFFLQAYQLYVKCDAINTHVTSGSRPTHPKDINRMPTYSRIIDRSYYSSGRESHRTMLDGRKTNHEFEVTGGYGYATSYLNFYTPGKSLEMEVLMAKSKIYLPKYRDYGWLSKEEEAEKENSAILSTNAKLVNIFNKTTLDTPFSARSFALTSFVKEEPRLILTRDFYDSHLELLNEVDHQMNLLQQTFQPHVLFKLLDTNPEFSTNLCSFLKKALNFHTQNREITKAGIFTYQYCYHLLTFIKAHPKADKMTTLSHWILSLEKGLLEILNLYKTMMKNQDYSFGSYENLVRTIDNLNRLYCIAKSWHQENDWSEHCIKLILSTQLFATINELDKNKNEEIAKAHRINPFFDEQFFYSMGRLKDKLKSQFLRLPKESQIKIVRELVEELMVPDFLPDSKFDITINYPRITVSIPLFKIELDLFLGKIINSNKYFSKKKPGTWAPALAGFFGENVLKVLVQERVFTTIYEFRHMDKDYKIILVQDNYNTPEDIKKKIPEYIKNTYILQQRMVDGKEYSLNYNNLQPLLPIKLGDHAFDLEKRWWQSIDTSGSRKYYCTDQYLNYLYEITESTRDAGRYGFNLLKPLSYVGIGQQRQSKQENERLEFVCHKLTPEGLRSGYTLVMHEGRHVSMLQQYLKHFEDEKFIEIWQAPDETSKGYKFLIKLIRYDLEWESRSLKNNNIEFVWTKNKDYKLIFTPVNPFIPGFKHFLAMENKKTGERIVLVPRQRFLPSSSADSNRYHKLEFDISNKINESNRIANKYHRVKNPDCFLANMKYKHTASSQYETFRIREQLSMKEAQEQRNDEWIADTPAGYLFLAYLCLGKYKPNMAMDALRACQKLGGIKANIDEVGLIHDIISDTPYMDYNSGLANTIKVMEPNTLAVRLYAAWMLFDQKLASFNKPETPYPTEPPQYSVNDVLNWLRIENMSKFYFGANGNQKFANSLRRLYFFYVQDREHVAANLLLSYEIERPILLSLISQDQNNVVAINRLRLLEMEHNIQQRERILYNAYKHDKKCTENESTELAELTKRITSQKTTLVRKAKIKSVDIDLTCDGELSSRAIDIFRYNKEIRDVSVDELDENTTPHEFIGNWNSYYRIAIEQNNWNWSAKTKLREICMQWVHYFNYAKNVGSLSQEEYFQDHFAVLLLYVLNNPMRSQRAGEEIEKDIWPIYKAKGMEDALHFLQAVKIRCERFSKEKPIKIKSQIKEYINSEKPLKYFDSVADASLLLRLNNDKFDNLLLETKYDTRPLVFELPLKDFYQAFSGIEVQSIEMPQVFQSAKEQDEFFIEINKNFNLDLKEGMKQNALRSLQEKIYQKYLGNPSVQEQALQRLKYNFNREEVVLKGLRHQLLEKANHALTGKNALHSSVCDVQGQMLAEITFQNLLWLYLQADVALYIEKTRLNRSEIQELYQHTHEYLIKATINQHRARVMQQLNILLKLKSDNPEYSDSLIILGEQLVAKRAYNPDHNPEILIFEYFDDKMLRLEQVNLLESLLKSDFDGFNNEVVQLIMGGGKSKVLLPLLALKKALGTNLSIIEVPPALFETNKADLKSTTMSLFGMNGVTINFDRSTEITPQNLLQLRDKLIDARVSRQYIITHGDATKSLQLKYLELLDAKGRDEEVQLLEQILILYRNKGDVIIDEGDTVLDPKLELNYPAGTPKPLPIEVLATVQKFFRLFSKVSIQVNAKEITLRDVALGNAVIVLEADWDLALERLLEVALSDKTLDYWKIMKEFPQNQMKHLKNFLLSKDQNLPEGIKTLNEQERNDLGFLKGQLALFKHCLRQKSNEHYGFPVSADFQGSKHVAIPYIANNTPNEKSEFGMIYEIINYTLLLQEQRTLIPLELLKRLVEEFKLMAKKEVAIKFGRVSIEETKVNKEFMELTTLSLNEVYPNENSLLKAQPAISASVKARDYIVLNYILSQIKDYPHILRANAINHVAQYRSAQTMTGTPWNAECFHPRFTFNQEKSFGTDGRTIDLLLQKNPAIKLAESDDPNYLIENFVLKHAKTHKIHALIDVGALFKGLGNEMIARLLCRILGSRAGNTIKHVLYYNQDNILCALPCRNSVSLSNPKEFKQDHNKLEVKQNKDLLNNSLDKTLNNIVNDAPIVLGGSDPKLILQKIGSRPNECFTYYDQRHTTGTDIKQAFDAIGVVTVDRDTKLRDLLQGAMRLRELRRSQEVEIILPKEVSRLKHDAQKSSADKSRDNNWNITDVLQLVQKNQSTVLATFNLRATMDKMDHIVRELMLTRIYATKDLAEKRKLRAAFSEAFLYNIPKNPFPLEAGEFETQKILDNHVKYNVEKYLRLLSKIDITPPLSEIEELKKVLLSIKDRGARFCLKRYENCAGIRDNNMQNMKQKEQEVQRQIEKEVMRRTERNTSELPYFPKKWSALPNEENEDNSLVKLFTLNSAIKLDNPNIKWDFSPSIKMTENFMTTIEGQKLNLGPFVKPVQFFIVIKDPGSQTLRVVIISLDELMDFMAFFNAKMDELKKQGYEIWVKTTHNVLWSGTSETIDIRRFPEYPMLLEQIRFFNGDIDLLIQERCSDWLLADFKQKSEVMRNLILQNHCHQVKYFEQFELTVSQELKEQQQNKVNTEMLFMAVKEGDFNTLDALLKELTSRVSQRTKRYLLNSPYGSKQDDLIGFAIQKGDMKIIKRLLDEPELLSFLSYSRSPLVVCAAHFNPGIFKTIFSDSRCFPHAANLEHWAYLTRNVLATHVDDIIHPYLIKMKSMIHPSIQKLLLPTLMSTLFETEVPYINCVLERLHLLIDNPKEIWRLFLLHTASHKRTELAIQLIENWHAKAPAPQVFEYITNTTKANEPCLLHEISDINLDLIKFLLNDKKKRFILSTDQIKQWTELLLAQNLEQIEFIAEYIKKHADPALLKNLYNHRDAAKRFFDIVDQSYQELKHTNDKDLNRANDRKRDHDRQRYQKLIEIFPDFNNKKDVEELITKIIRFQMFNNSFYQEDKMVKKILLQAGETGLKAIDNLFMEFITKSSYYTLRLLSEIDFKLPINNQYGLRWFKLAVEYFHGNKDRKFYADQTAIQLLKGGVFEDTQQFKIEAFVIALNDTGYYAYFDSTKIKQLMDDYKLSPNMIYKGQPLLMYNAVKRHAVSRLIELKADADIRYKANGDKQFPGSEFNGYTPLMLHVKENDGGYESTVTSLLNANCNPNIKNAKGQTALDIFKEIKGDQWDRHPNTWVSNPLLQAMGLKK